MHHWLETSPCGLTHRPITITYRLYRETRYKTMRIPRRLYREIAYIEVACIESFLYLGQWEFGRDQPLCRLYQEIAYIESAYIESRLYARAHIAYG